MYHQGQVILKSPLYLYPERLYLIVQAALVPIEIQTRLTYSYITVSAAGSTVAVQEGFESVQLTVEIVGKILGMESNHGTTHTGPCVAHVQKCR